MTVVKVQQRVVAVEATDELADLFGNGDKSGHLATPTSGFSRGVPQLIRGIRRQQPRVDTWWVTGNRQVPRNAGQATAWVLHVWDEPVQKSAARADMWWRARLPGSLPSGVVPRSICTAYVVEMTMVQERQVRLFRNGRNQALRIPRDLELPGRAATLRKEGSRLIVEPVAGPSLLAVLATLKPLAEELPRIARPVAEPVEM